MDVATDTSSTLRVLQARKDRAENDNSGELAGTGAGKANLANEIQRLTDLHDDGVLTDEEFKAAKAKLLGL